MDDLLSTTPDYVNWSFSCTNCTESFDRAGNGTGSPDSDSTTVGPTVSPSVSPIFYICISSFLILFCVVSLAVNVAILSSICFIKPNRTLFISLSLAAADTVSLFWFALSLTLFSFLPRVGIISNLPCVFLTIEAFRMGAIFTTLFHLAFVAIYHYIGILLPMSHSDLMKRRNIQYCVVVLWTVPTSLVFLDMFFLEGDGFEKCISEFLIRQRFRARYAISFFTTLGLMVFAYTRIFLEVHRGPTRQMDCHSKNSCGASRQSMKARGQAGKQYVLRRNKARIVTTLLYLASLVVCWTPAFLYWALFCKDCLFHRWWKTNTMTEFVIISLINFLLIFKTATNIYLYAIRTKQIKDTLREKMNCLLSRQSDRRNPAFNRGYSSYRSDSTWRHTEMSLGQPLPTHLYHSQSSILRRNQNFTTPL